MSSNLDWSFQDYLSENVRFDDFVDYGAYAGTSEDLGELFEASSLDVVYPQGGLSAVGPVDAWKTQSISEPSSTGRLSFLWTRRRPLAIQSGFFF